MTRSCSSSSVFFLVGIARLVDHGFGKLVGEFFLVIIVLVNEFVNLLEKAFVGRSGDGPEEPPKAASSSP